MTITTRLATAADVPEIVRLRRLLFASLGQERGGWERACADVLEQALTEGSMVAAVVDSPAGAGLAAVGTAEVQQRLPKPANPSGRQGYIGTMVTEPQHRRRGLAGAVLQRLLAELRARGIDRIELHATAPAESLYRAAGFTERPGGLEMRLLDA